VFKSVERSAFVVISLVIGLSLNNNTCLAKSSTVDANNAKDGNVLHPYNANALHRLDFRVVGKSCAVCLHRMQERMKELPGTVQAAIMLKKPYGAVVIYDSSKVKSAKIFEKCAEGLTGVDFEDKKDVPIKALPLLLIPAIAAPGATEQPAH
jgi:hypothetical protein